MSVLDGPGEGTWSAFALQVVEQRDALEERLEQMTKERDREREEWAHRRWVHASDSRQMARERDEALAEVKTWKHDWYVAKADLGTAMRLADVALRDVAEKYERALRERDEARAQLAAIGTGAPCDGHRHCCADRRRLAEELLRVRAERDALKEEL